MVGFQGSSKGPLEVSGHELKGTLVINTVKFSLVLFNHVGTNANQWKNQIESKLVSLIGRVIKEKKGKGFKGIW